VARCLRDLLAEQAFERLRRARVEKIIARVNYDKAPGPVGRVLRDLMFPVAMRMFYDPERMMGWLHRHTIDWDTPMPGAAARRS
jgi:FAD-dependent urate hydroxylase